MEQPSGYVDTSYPNHVCRLRKALYGLKPPPCAWFQRFNDFVTRLGFKYIQADTSLSVLCKEHTNLYLLVYVEFMIFIEKK